MRFYTYRGDGLTVAEEVALERKRGGRRPGTGAHGKRRWYDLGCRCEACVAGNEARVARNAERRRRRDAGNPPSTTGQLW